MICIKEKDKIKKYEIEIDKDKLKELRIDIINDCSHILHIKADSVLCHELPNKRDKLKIRNYTVLNERYLGVVYDHSLPDIYDIEYDLYEYPPIIEKIDKILDDKKDSYAYEFLDFLTSNVIKKETWEKTLNQGVYTGSDKINKNQKPVGYYYEDLINCIKLIFIDEMDYAKFNEAYTFIDSMKNKEENFVLVRDNK